MPSSPSGRWGKRFDKVRAAYALSMKKDDDALVSVSKTEEFNQV
jgi:hypothetical protein